MTMVNFIEEEKMVITKEDVYGFEDAYEKHLIKGNFHSNFGSWLNKNPQILMVENYTDFTSTNTYNNMLKELVEYNIIDADQPLFRQITGEWVIPYEFGRSKKNKWW